MLISTNTSKGKHIWFQLLDASLKKNTYDLTYSMLWKILKKRFFEIQYYEAFPLFNFSTFRNSFCVLSDSCSVFFEPSTFPCIPHVAIQRIYVNAIFSMFLVLDARNLLEGPLTYTPGLAQGDSQFCWYWPTGCSSKVKSATTWSPLIVAIL